MSGNQIEKLKSHCKIWKFNHGFKVGLSPSKEICVICLIEHALKMTENAFYFIFKALSILKIFYFLSGLFGHVGKIRLTSKFMTS